MVCFNKKNLSNTGNSSDQESNILDTSVRRESSIEDVELRGIVEMLLRSRRNPQPTPARRAAPLKRSKRLLCKRVGEHQGYASETEEEITLGPLQCSTPKSKKPKIQKIGTKRVFQVPFDSSDEEENYRLEEYYKKTPDFKTRKERARFHTKRKLFKAKKKFDLLDRENERKHPYYITLNHTIGCCDKSIGLK